MSTDALPSAPAAVAAKPVSGRVGMTKKRDRARLARLEQLRAEGLSDLAAWERVCLDPKLGLMGDVRRGYVRPERLSRTYCNFLERVRPGAAAEAAAVAKDRLVAAAGSAAQTIVDLAAGDFGEGKVRVRGESETVEVDAAAARVRLDASKTILGVLPGVLPDRAPAPSIQAVQVNAGPTAHDIADALRTLTPEQRAAAHDLANRLAAAQARE